MNLIQFNQTLMQKLGRNWRPILAKLNLLFRWSHLFFFLLLESKQRNLFGLVFFLSISLLFFVVFFLSLFLFLNWKCLMDWFFGFGFGASCSWSVPKIVLFKRKKTKWMSTSCLLPPVVPRTRVTRSWGSFVLFCLVGPGTRTRSTGPRSSDQRLRSWHHRSFTETETPSFIGSSFRCPSGG